MGLTHDSNKTLQQKLVNYIVELFNDTAEELEIDSLFLPGYLLKVEENKLEIKVSDGSKYGLTDKKYNLIQFEDFVGNRIPLPNKHLEVGTINTTFIIEYKTQLENALEVIDIAQKKLSGMNTSLDDYNVVFNTAPLGQPSDPQIINDDRYVLLNLSIYYSAGENFLFGNDQKITLDGKELNIIQVQTAVANTADENQTLGLIDQSSKLSITASTWSESLTIMISKNDMDFIKKYIWLQDFNPDEKIEYVKTLNGEVDNKSVLIEGISMQADLGSMIAMSLTLKEGR